MVLLPSPRDYRCLRRHLPPVITRPTPVRDDLPSLRLRRRKEGMSGPWTGPGGVCRRPGPHERELRYPDETRALKLG